MLEILIASQAAQDKRIGDHDRRIASVVARRDPQWWWPFTR